MADPRELCDVADIQIEVEDEPERPKEPPRSQVIDLMEVLKASLRAKPAPEVK